MSLLSMGVGDPFDPYIFISLIVNSVALTARPKIEFDMKKIKRTSAKYDFIAFEIFGT